MKHNIGKPALFGSVVVALALLVALCVFLILSVYRGSSDRFPLDYETRLGFSSTVVDDEADWKNGEAYFDGNVFELGRTSLSDFAVRSGYSISEGAPQRGVDMKGTQETLSEEHLGGFSVYAFIPDSLAEGGGYPDVMYVNYPGLKYLGFRR